MNKMTKRFHKCDDSCKHPDEKPKITKATSAKPYVKISFLPDYERFGSDGITEDMFNLFKQKKSF